MERSSRFISLSGWSGIWAGSVALIAAVIAHHHIGFSAGLFYRDVNTGIASLTDPFYLYLLLLAAATLMMAAAGAFFFTMRKARHQGLSIWGGASKKLFISVIIPLIAGGIFCLSFLENGNEFYIAPACLAFYGMALVNGGKYTLGEIRYLGYSELLLGCICLFFPVYGLYFWAAGFGLLHIIYGIIMWNRYDKKEQKDHS
jgi:hypothetical protein